MKRLVLLIVVIAILGAGGTLTALTSTDWSATSIPGAKVQCADPACSVFAAEPWEAGQLILLIGFIMFNLVGMGATIALLFWFLSKQIANVKASRAPSPGGTAVEKA